MKKLLTIIFSLFALNAYAVTLEWDHCCSTAPCGVSQPIAEGFNVYQLNEQDQNPYRIQSVSCPNTEADIVGLRGYYFITAFNEHGESPPSNHLLLAQYHFNSVRYEVDSVGRVIYKGEHQEHDAATSSVDWIITRYYYDSSGFLIHKRIRTTSWDDRATGW